MPTSSLQQWRDTYAPDILGDSHAIVRALEQARRIAECESSALLTGEVGAGKELFARAIHRGSARRNGPFIVVDTSAMPEALIAAELFGCTTAAFKGTIAARSGRIAAADGGTLFFDEIGDLSLGLQGKLVRVLEERTLRRLGAEQATAVDIRVLAATHQDLEARVEAGTFRAELLLLCSLVQLPLPPLRGRGQDVCVLAEEILRRTSAYHGVTGLDDSARRALLAHPWAGNLPELHRAVDRGLRAATGPLLTDLDLDLDRTRRAAAAAIELAIGSNPQLAPVEADAEIRAALAGLERRLIHQALQRTSGDRAQAAARLGLTRTSLVEKLRKPE